MLHTRVPVAVFCADPLEQQTFEALLGQSESQPLCLAHPTHGPQPLLALCTPEGINTMSVPALVLGHDLALPARWQDIQARLEQMAQAYLTPPACLVWKDHTLDMGLPALSLPTGTVVPLTETEARLLLLLFTAQGKPVPRDTLLEQALQYHKDAETHTIETHIYRLRQKIETLPNQPVFLLTTETGYALGG